MLTFAASCSEPSSSLVPRRPARWMIPPTSSHAARSAFRSHTSSGWSYGTISCPPAARDRLTHWPMNPEDPLTSTFMAASPVRPCDLAEPVHAAVLGPVPAGFAAELPDGVGDGERVGLTVDVLEERVVEQHRPALIHQRHEPPQL